MIIEFDIQKRIMAKETKAYMERMRKSNIARDCHRFGINDGCKPHCPVFERGDCEIQEENERLFNED